MAVPLPGAPPPYGSLPPYSSPPPYSASPASSPAQILHQFLTTSSYAHILFPVARYNDEKAQTVYDLGKELERELEFEKAGMKLSEVLEIEYVYGLPRIRVMNNELSTRS